MKRRLLLQAATMGTIAGIGLACIQIHPPTQCQLYVPDTKWSQAGLQAVLESPSNRNCPVSLPNFRYLIDYHAVISAPYGVPALLTFGQNQVETRIFDAEGFQAGTSFGNFGVGNDGREYAHDQGFYYAGQISATSKLQQDAAHTLVPLSSSAGGGTAQNSIYIPYQCCQVQTLAAALPKAPRGTTVKIRTWTNFTSPSYAWYLNGVQILERPCTTCNLVSPGAEYSRTMSTAGTFTWKIIIAGTYAGQSKTIQFNMVVN